MKVLVVDDDEVIRELLAFAVAQADLVPLRAADGATALRLFEREAPDLLLLDVALDGTDGLEVLREVRRRSDVPVILVTGRTGEDDKIRGLELGANDYISKPFSYRELVARIRAQTRRIRVRDEHGSDGKLTVGRLTLDLSAHRAAIDERPLRLTVTEFRLLRHLMLRSGSVVSTRTLLREVWGYSDPDGSEVVRVTLHRLRRKLAVPGDPVDLIHTVPGVGVMLKAVSPASQPSIP